MTLKIGYLGPKGTFTEAALYRYLKKTGLQAETTPFSSIMDLFRGLDAGDCDQIIVPSENSVEGSVNTTLDLLNTTEGITIQEEWTLPIQQTLMAKPGTNLSDVTDVVSHAQALAQSKQFLANTLPKAHTHGVASTALAAELIQTDSFLAHDNQEHIYAIIGNRDLGGLYGLDILHEAIQDNPNNATRFFLIGRTPTQPTGSDKTSIIITSPKDTAGSLCKLLQEFSRREINLTKIVSRPTQQNLGEYVFFIDCDGHAQDPNLKEALHAIESLAATFKHLGSYKHDRLEN